MPTLPVYLAEQKKRSGHSRLSLVQVKPLESAGYLPYMRGGKKKGA